MAVFKCKMCGGDLEVSEQVSIGTCGYCGSTMTLPRLDDDRRINLYDRANHFRRNGEFDKATSIYESILNEDKTDAEAYWSLVLCEYGIEYVEDPSTHKRVPTCNRTQFTSIFADENYKQAIANADSSARAIYEQEAKAIDAIQKGILAISSKEDPFDVFICYKESDNNGRRTPDSVLAQDLYYQLKQEGFKVFFSRITLEDKLGIAYEPYIFAALNSAKVMVVVGTQPEHFNAIWVKNEWSRYLALIKTGAKKTLVPAYKDMDPYDLPEEFSHLQAQDMSKLGFMQDLIRGIKKIVASDQAKAATIKETTVIHNANTEKLLERAYICLEDKDWDKADALLEQVLNLEPRSAKAYVGKLMAEQRISHESELAFHATPLTEYNSFVRASGFAGEKYREILKGYNETILDRIEDERKESAYQAAFKQKNVGYYQLAAQAFMEMSGYKDSEYQAEECRRLKEQARIEAERKAEQAKIDLEQAKIEAERKAEQARIAGIRRIEKQKIEADELKKKSIKILKITVPSVLLVIVFFILLNTVIIPSNKYGKAMDLMADKQYAQAAEMFVALKDYKDSREQLSEIEIPLIKQAQVGDRVYYGNYEQEEKTANGKEAIVWKVLAVESGKVLLISDKCLDSKSFNKSDSYVTWEDSTIRAWLNKDFFNTAFSKMEQSKIALTKVTNGRDGSNGRDGGDDTNDQVFLLSFSEANKYFDSDNARQATPTAQGGGCSWWLRTPGYYSNSVSHVNSSGFIANRKENTGHRSYTSNNGVRPALWLNLTS